MAAGGRSGERAKRDPARFHAAAGCVDKTRRSRFPAESLEESTQVGILVPSKRKSGFKLTSLCCETRKRTGVRVLDCSVFVLLFGFQKKRTQWRQGKFQRVWTAMGRSFGGLYSSKVSNAAASIVRCIAV